MKISVIAIFILLALGSTALSQAAPQPTAASTPALQDMANPMTTLLTTAKVVGAFILVAGLMALLFKVMGKMGLGNNAAVGGLISVLETRAIAPKKYISVVQIGNKQLAIGIAENSISLLCPLEEPLPRPTSNSARPTPFANLLANLRRQKKGEEQ